MHIKAILLPIEALSTVSTKDTINKALDIIENNNFLSIPVVDNKEFIGFISKKYIFETFFKSSDNDRVTFLQKPVKEFMKTKIPVLKENVLLDEAANIFLEGKVRFIPVVNDSDEFIGIITQKEIFKTFRRIYGIKDPRITIYTYDIKGNLAKITDIVSKNNGNITSIVQLDTEVMGLQEISLRIRTSNIDKIISRLKHHGFDVRKVISQ